MTGDARSKMDCDRLLKIARRVLMNDDIHLTWKYNYAVWRQRPGMDEPKMMMYIGFKGNYSMDVIDVLGEFEIVFTDDFFFYEHNRERIRTMLKEAKLKVLR